jgi:hypothetical protein
MCIEASFADRAAEGVGVGRSARLYAGSALSETMTVAELLVNWRRASIYALANDEFAIQAAQVLAQDNGLRRGCVGKRRLGLRDDWRLREWQQIRQPDAGVRIVAMDLKLLQILVRHDSGITVQLRHERGHTRW